MQRILFTIGITLQLSQACIAQDVDREAFHQTDSLVSLLGPMPDSSLKSIIRSSTALCHDQVCVVRAIYKWVTGNIVFDCDAARHPEQSNSSASYVFATRTGTPKGYASLVAEMCRIAGITCEMVNGVAKSDPEDIGHVDNEHNVHTWNVVHAMDRLFVLDAAWGAGYCEGRDFKKDATDAWFLTNRKLFALCHYPRDKSRQLLDTPVERSAFVAAPVIGPVASVLGIFPMPGQRGILRGRQDSSVKISFIIKPVYFIERIRKTAISVDGVTTEIPFSKSSNTLSVIIPFRKEGKYPLTLLVNNGWAISFRVEASPRLKPAAGK